MRRHSPCYHKRLRVLVPPLPLFLLLLPLLLLLLLLLLMEGCRS